MEIFVPIAFKGEFFEVLGQTDLSQIAVMTIAAGSDSGPEDVHDGDQVVYVIEGEVTLEINGEREQITAGRLAIVPKGAQHHLYNTSQQPAFLLHIYTPPQY